MKKYLILISVILLGLFLFSCKGDIGHAGAAGKDGKPLYVMMFQNEVYPNSSYTDISDTYLLSANPDNNYGDCGLLNAGTQGYYFVRSLIKFDNLFNYIPPNATIVNAQLVIYGVNAITYTSNTYQIYKVTHDWTEGTTCNSTGSASWNTYIDGNSWTTPGGDFDPEPISDAVRINTFVAYYSFNLNKDVVKSWITSPTTNYGMLIKLTDETQDGVLIFASREEPTLSWRPKLVIYYTLD